ncbi:MAG: hypothetical protein WCI78_18380 [Mycobacterium sp.]
MMAATALAISGCGGEAGRIVDPVAKDDIEGHWVAAQQSATLTGARSPVAIDTEVSFTITQAGLNVWSGTVTCTSGTLLDPGFGPWMRANNSYSVSNATGQNGVFGWSGSELYSTTRVGAETVYLWWAKR